MPASTLLVTLVVPTLMAAGLAVTLLASRRPERAPVPVRAPRRRTR